MTFRNRIPVLLRAMMNSPALATCSCSGREPGYPGPPAQVGSRTGAPALAEASRPCHVSSPLHVARNVRVSRIARPHSLHAEAYGTYPARSLSDLSTKQEQN